MLDKVVAAVEDEAERLVEEFHRPGGPRGHDSHCEVDREIEERLRQSLQAILPAAFAGEETGMNAGRKPGFTWQVGPAQPFRARSRLTRSCRYGPWLSS